MSAFQNGGAPARAIDDDSDVEEETLAGDYIEQVHYEGMEELEPVTSMSMAQQTDDIQSRLAAAAQPLDFSAPLEVKFASYDNYCSLFHFILNSDGPVDLEPPSVSISQIRHVLPLTLIIVLLGLGCYRRIHLPIQLFLLVSKPRRASRVQPGRNPNPPRSTEHMGLLQRSQRPVLPHPTFADQ
jgi:hypothetical protein